MPHVIFRSRLHKFQKSSARSLRAQVICPVEVYPNQTSVSGQLLCQVIAGYLKLTFRCSAVSELKLTLEVDIKVGQWVWWNDFDRPGGGLFPALIVTPRLVAR
jgi:hypothetical protein